MQTKVLDDPSEAKEVRARRESVLRALNPGDTVAIRETHGSLLRFTITEVVSNSRGRIETKAANAYGYNRWYCKSGKNTMQPVGQSSLVEATPEVRAWAERFGKIGYGWYRTRHSPNWWD